MNITDKTETGRISEIRKNRFTIRFAGQDYPAKLKGSFYGQEADMLPVVGDYVEFEPNTAGESMILSLHKRTSLLQRPDQSKTGVMQYMVANVDYTFIVTSLNGDYSYNRIARYVSVALQGGSIPVVVLTKSDLCSNAGRYVREVRTISDIVRVHAVCAIYDTGLDELKQYFAPGVTVCFLGSSGAGKSTLINSIAGKNIMKTASVRESDSKGRHTTTHRHLIELPNGASIIDTPGMREIGMASVEDGIDDTFSDIVELEKYCRFGNCRHETEPGCAVKAAIENGELSSGRWMLYKSLHTENTRNHVLKKQISKWHRSYDKISHRIPHSF